MLYSEIIAVCSQIHTKHINTLCEQNVEFVSVIPGGTYCNHWALQSSTSSVTAKNQPVQILEWVAKPHFGA
jgi:hypothetical protein